jgi:hypothetical protein
MWVNTTGYSLPELLYVLVLKYVCDIALKVSEYIEKYKTKL